MTGEWFFSLVSAGRKLFKKFLGSFGKKITQNQKAGRDSVNLQSASDMNIYNNKDIFKK